MSKLAKMMMLISKIGLSYGLKVIKATLGIHASKKKRTVPNTQACAKMNKIC